MSENRRSAVTLEAVAARAGVSRATASRVLNGSTRVSARARDSVRAAADDLGYVPNSAARSLVTRQSDALAFVVAESEDVFFSDPFFAPVLRGAHAAAAERGRPLLFVIVATDDDRARVEQYAAGGHVDGVMFVSVHSHDTLPRRVHQLGVPVVLAGRPPRGRPALPYVSSDNLGGGAAAARVLLERGCTRIATITGPEDMTVTPDRLEGFRQGLASAGVELSAERIVAGDFSMAGGRAAMVELLDNVPDVDGLFAANDLMAVAAIQVAAERGRVVPDDLAVVGFDDVPVAASSSPQLTTIRQPLDAMGRQMARLLIDAAEGLDVTSLVLETEVVGRESA